MSIGRRWIKHPEDFLCCPKKKLGRYGASDLLESGMITFQTLTEERQLSSLRGYEK